MVKPEKFADEEGEQGARRTSGFKRIFLTGGLLAVLLWGTSFLFSVINQFQSNRIAIQEYERLVRLNHTNLLPQGLRKDFFQRPILEDGKIPLNHSAVTDYEFKVNTKTFQWFQARGAAEGDKGTYLEQDGDLFLMKSIVNEDYEVVLYNGSSFDFNNNSYQINLFLASPDLKKALLVTNRNKKWRHSSTALYWVLDLSSSDIYPLNGEDDRTSAASWSPTSNHVAFISQNDIYIHDVLTKQTEQVTTDGSTEVFNGIPDWVYEEEIFGTDITLWWSPDGTKFTYLRIDDIHTPEYTIPLYVQRKDQDYPDNMKLKYPKPGFPIPIVDVYLYDLSKNHSTLLDLPSKEISDRLVNEIFWVHDSVLVKTTNRLSTILEVFLVDTNTLESQLVRSVKTSNEWIEVSSNALYVPRNESLGRKQDGYIDTVSYNGYRHLAYFSPPNASHGRPLTMGNWEVVDGVAAFDQSSNEVYFKSTLKSSIERHFHSISLLDSQNANGLPSIKNITEGEGYYSGSFSSGSKYLLLNYQGPDVPNQKLFDLHSGKYVKTIEDNAELKKKLNNYAIPKPSYQIVTLTDSETKAQFKVNALEIRPHNFDPSREYPVLFYGYGGPGLQLVSKTFSVGFSAAIASELDCIVVTVDGRGTGYNSYNDDLGLNFQFIVKDNLGYYEAKDQIAAATLWASKDYVDSKHIAIWGWSYGGYLTLKTLEANNPPVFSFGLAVAPVTSWHFYNAIYTERYMGSPHDNTLGYNVSTVHNNITNFSLAKKFFLAHGTGDDNVHIQNTLKLVDDFNLESIENFELMVFPDSDHSISYHNGFKVIYGRITDFFGRAFAGDFD
ncbi:uncharacterized protein PRCAT00006314001 [Priceomyces carsonii]|uniref:uncharacterized protein n=1 Tax=Priceomyces carsonii TaxID=28549 RepID=UPI002ED79785|nr:unnamed protein product [Priceomyces carsonii]